jgi:antirestriction protein ArdC
VPWRKPWSGSDPQNLTTQKAYRGINSLVLGCASRSTPFWLTYKQAAELGAAPRAGEKGTPIVFWKFLQKDNAESGEKDVFPMLRHYTVFNADQVFSQEQCGRFMATLANNEFHPLEECEKVVSGWIGRPPIEHCASGGAFYRPRTDSVTMPLKESFASAEGYYATLFHELGHSTGHEKRLNRESLKKVAAFGSHEYSKEELVAEMASGFLCAATHIDGATIENSASYIQSWLNALKNDRTLLVRAAGQAQKAADMILGTTFEEHAD